MYLLEIYCVNHVNEIFWIKNFQFFKHYSQPGQHAAVCYTAPFFIKRVNVVKYMLLKIRK